MAGKEIARILLDRLLSSAAKLVLPDSQCGFRGDRGTVDMIFTAQLLMEKTREQHQDLFFAFVDLAKAFDTVNRELLWRIMEKKGCPPKFMSIIKSFHNGMTARVCAGGLLSDPFEVTVGVKQGCVLAPTIFNLYLSAITLLARYNLSTDDGITINYRLDGSIFNLRRLKATTKTNTMHLFDLQYADDAAYTAPTCISLQNSIDIYESSYSAAGLQVNAIKTEILCCRFNQAEINEPPPIFTLNNQQLKNVDTFKYLGSFLSSSCDIEYEIQNCIRLASSSFGKLKGRVFLNRNLTVKTKVNVYRAVCLSILLYGSETWTVYRAQVRRLEAFHIRCLQNILGVSWQDRIPHATIFKSADVNSIECMVITRQLKWVGHVIRMPENRIPRQVFYGELKTGHRSIGGQKKRYRDQLNSWLKQSGIPPGQLELLACDRSTWCGLVNQASETFEAGRTAARMQQRERRHDRQNRGPPPMGIGVQCPTCSRWCASEFGLRSHMCTHR